MEPLDLTDEAMDARLIKVAQEHLRLLMEDAGMSWVLTPGDPGDPTDARPPRRLMPEAPVVVVAPEVALARLKRRDELKDAALAHGVLPSAVIDYLGRMEAPRPASQIDPTSDGATDAETHDAIRRAAPHLFEAPRARTARDPW